MVTVSYFASRFVSLWTAALLQPITQCIFLQQAVSRMRCFSVVLALFLASVSFSFVAGIQNKCSACLALATELREALETEPRRDPLDYRGRLDSTGVRFGKVVDWRVSEERVDFLLDGLTQRLANYIFKSEGEGRTGGGRWVKSSEVVNDPVLKAKHAQHNTRLKAWAAALLESIEDEVVEKLRDATFVPAEVESFLCGQTLTKLCRDVNTSEVDGKGSDGAPDVVAEL